MLLESESFTIYEVEDLKSNFILELANEKIVIDIKNVTKIDMSAISLLISLKKTSIEEKKEFTLQNCSDSILLSLSICGCDSYLGV